MEAMWCIAVTYKMNIKEVMCDFKQLHHTSEYMPCEVIIKHAYLSI